MNWNKFLIAGVIASVIAYVVGWVWHVPLFGDFYAEQQAAIRTGQPMLEAVIVAEVLRGFILAFIYPFGYKGGVPWQEGLRFGILLGVFASVSPLIAASQYQYASFNWFWMQALFLLIQQGVAGIAIAYVYGTQAGKPR